MITQLFTLNEDELEALKRLTKTPEYETLNKVFNLLRTDRIAEMIEMVPEDSIDYSFNSGRVRGSILLMESFNKLGIDIEEVIRLKKEDKAKKV